MKSVGRYDSGAIMLEALIVYPVTLFLLFYILALFGVLYQDWNVQTIANETAARIAQTYKYEDADVDTGFVSMESLKKTNPYRYFVLANASHNDKIEAKAVDYAKRRLARTTFTKSVGDPTIKAQIEHDALGRNHIEVVITSTYTVPFGNALNYFGLKGTVSYTAKAYAECLDLSDYVTVNDFVDYYSSLGILDSSTIKLINSILELFGLLK